MVGPVRIIWWEGLLVQALMFALILREAVGRRSWWLSLLRAEELQLLLVTAAVCARVLVAMGMRPTGAMPGLGAGWLVLFGVSGGLYGVAKGLRGMQGQ